MKKAILFLILAASVFPAYTQLNVAVLAPLSESAPAFGLSVRDGSLLAFEEWNATGGLLGGKIASIVEDSQCSPDPAVSAANRAISQEKVRFIIGEVCSSASVAVSMVANAAKIIMISPTSTDAALTVDSSGKTLPYVFRVCPLDSWQANAAAKFAGKNLNAKKAFLLSDPGSTYVTGLSQAFETAFTQLGGKIVGRETYDGKTTTDFTPILAKVRAANPDIVYLPDSYVVAGHITRQAKDKGIGVPFLGSDGWDSPALDRKGASGSYFTTQFSPDDPRPEVVSFLKAYGANHKDAYGKPKVPDALAALAYDATNLLFTAIKTAGTDNSDDVKGALEKIAFKGVCGKITFDAQHNAMKSVTILKVEPQGARFETIIDP